MRYLYYWAILMVFGAVSVFAANTANGSDAPAGMALRGHLRQVDGQTPYIEMADHKHVVLHGDEATLKVLNDDRLKDSDFEVLGHYAGDNRFEINGIYTPSLFVYRDGKRMQVSYWCDVCYIRTSSPGKCWCCQKETNLDPVEPGH